MQLPEEFKDHRYLLVAMGTDKYKKLPKKHILPGVEDEIKLIVTLFQKLGYQRKLAEQSYNPTSDWIRKEIPRFKQTLTGNDLLVFYYTGHGYSDSDRFYLLTRDSTEDDYDSTAVPAAELARFIGKGAKAKQILLIIDTCYSGAGAFDILQVARGITKDLEQDTAIYIITAARPRELALVGKFAQAFSDTLRNQNSQIGGRNQPFLASDDIMGALNKNLDTLNPNQKASLSGFNIRDRCCLFPNPRYNPEIPEDIDLESQRVFEAHWLPKARGAETKQPGAWYFTGRTRALQELVSWLTGRDQRKGLLVVTGNAGSGKSALLGRVVTLSSRAYRDSIVTGVRGDLDPSTIPPRDAIDVNIHLRHQSLPGVLSQLKKFLDIQATDVDELIAGIAARGKTVLLMDALDEADERDKILEKLLKPLGEIANVKLIVGTRPDATREGRRFNGLGGQTLEIDLDHPDFIGATDIADYVAARLLAKAEPGRKTPYTGKPDIAQTVAVAVAGKANNNFLAAYTAAQWLLSKEEPVDIDVSGWSERLPLGLKDTFAEFLKQMAVKTGGQLSADKTKAVLTALAFSEGSGMPWAGILAPVAAAVSRVAVADPDIDRVFHQAAAFVIEALENDRSVYRIFHEDLAAYLRTGFSEKEVHKSIAAILHENVPKIPGTSLADWSRAHPYILLHLAGHALKGDYLGELSRDIRFLGYADPERLTSALNRATDDISDTGRCILNSAWYEIVHLSPLDRVVYLGLIAAKWSIQDRYKGFNEWAVGQPWKARWASWRQPFETPHKVLKKNIAVSCLTLAEIRGKTIIAAGCFDGSIHILDADTGKSIIEPLRGHEGWLESVAVGSLGQKSLIVSGGEDETIRVWDLETGKPIGQPLRGHEWGVTSVAVGILNEKPLIVSGSRDNTIRVWDLKTGQQIGEPLRGHEGSVNSIAIGMLNKNPIVVSGSDDHTIRVWDLETGKSIGKPLRGHEGLVYSVAVGSLNQKPLIVSGSDDETIRAWDLETGKQIGQPLRGHENWVTSITVGRLGQKPVIVSGSHDQTIRVWDLETGQQIGEPLRGHEGQVSSVAVGRLGQKPVIVSGSDDDTIRVWDLGTIKSVGQPLMGHEKPVTSVSVVMLGQKPLIVSGSEDQAIRFWDLATGEPSVQPLRGHESYITSVAVGRLGQKPLIVSGGDDQTICIWGLATGRPIVQPLTGHEWGITSVAIGMLGQKPVIVSGSKDKTIRVWDLETGRPIVQPLRGHESYITSVAVGMLNQKPLVVSGSWDETIRVWDLEGRRSKVIDIGSKCHSVAIFEDSTIIVGTDAGIVVLDIGDHTWDDAQPFD